MKDLDYIKKGQGVSEGFTKTLRHKSGPIFQQLEITLTGLCNRSCSFCPRSDSSIYPSTKTYLSIDSLNQVFSDLSNYNYAGRISYSGFGEPFTHPDIAEIIKSCRKILPNAQIDIITNGDLFNLKSAKIVLEERNFNRILVSVYDGEDQYAALESNYSELISDECLLLRKRYLTSDDDEFDLFSNRTGLVDYSALGKDFKNTNQSRTCYYPYYNILVDSNGDAVACSHDWSKKIVFGNILNKSILDIWFGEKYKSFRNNMLQNPRCVSPCATCSVDGQMYGEELFNDYKSSSW